MNTTSLSPPWSDLKSVTILIYSTVLAQVLILNWCCAFCLTVCSAELEKLHINWLLRAITYIKSCETNNIFHYLFMRSSRFFFLLSRIFPSCQFTCSGSPSKRCRQHGGHFAGVLCPNDMFADHPKAPYFSARKGSWMVKQFLETYLQSAWRCLSWKPEVFFGKWICLRGGTKIGGSIIQFAENKKIFPGKGMTFGFLETFIRSFPVFLMHAQSCS